LAVALAMAIGLESGCASEPAAIIHRRQRRSAHGVCRPATVFGLMLLGRRSSGPPMSAVCFQPPATRLCPSAGAGVAVVLCGGGPPATPAYANTIAAGALVLALTYVTFDNSQLYHGPVADQRPHRWRRAYTLSIAWLAFA